MDAPQSHEDVQAVVEALQRLDPLLDVRWNPQAIRTAPASFDAFGRATKSPTYDGRWEVIRHKTPGLHADRDWVRITMVTETTWVGTDGRTYPVMQHNGAYAPLGMWLVDYMALWDRANSAWIKAMEELGKDHDRADQWLRDDEQAGNQEVAERFYREHAGEYWKGGAHGKTDNAQWLGDAKRIVVVSK